MSIADKLTQIAENEQKVYDKGFSDGKATGGYTEGYEDGKQAEYDAFWDAAQNYGTKGGYARAFSGSSWNNQTFKPKYNIIAGSNSYGAFCYSEYPGSLKELLSTQGITLTFPNCSNIGDLFAHSKFTEIGILDFSTVTAAAPQYIFNGCSNLHTIEKIILSQKVSFTFLGWFLSCKALENIAFEGVIANDIDFSACTKLTKDSITNIIDHLSDTASGKTLTLSATAIYNAFGASPQDWDGDGNKEGWVGSQEWLDLISSKSNWTIVGI